VAKLVPAVCPKCGANVQLDPDREFVTCTFCGASSFVQTQKRQPTAYVQAHALPVIQVQQAAGFLSGCTGAIVVVVVVFGVLAAAVGGVVAYFSVSAATAVAPAAPPGKVEAASPLIEEDYYADATLAKAHFEKVLGKPIMAKQLTLLQYYATLEAQDPKNHEHVDSYKLWANAVERPQPVQLGSDKQRLDQILFSLDAVDFRLVRGMLKSALLETKIEEGKVQVVTLTRDAQSKEPVWRVVVNGSRDNAMIEFSVTGKKLRSFN
jgi:hypothetical protein